MNDSTKAFYEWFDGSGKFGTQLETLREAFTAGWDAAQETAKEVLPQDAEV